MILGSTSKVYKRRLALLNSLDPSRYLALASLCAEEGMAGQHDIQFLVENGLADIQKNKGRDYINTYLPTYRGLAIRRQLRRH